MRVGHMKQVENLDLTFGADPRYWMVKVQMDFAADNEEYLLFTDSELRLTRYRVSRNREDIALLDLNKKNGVLTRIKNKDALFGADEVYVAFSAQVQGQQAREWLLLTESTLDAARDRVKRCPRTVEANKTGWVADLFD